jgi:uncharacterized delta-60 repeat protein
MNDIKFNCPQCGQHLAVDATGVGMTVACPKCGQAIIVPSIPASGASVTPNSSAKTKWWLWSLMATAATVVALVAVWFLAIRQPGMAKLGQETKAESSAPPRAPRRESGSTSQSPGAETSSAQPYKKIVTFQTKEPAPPQFDAWEFVWSLGNVDPNTKLDYVVLQPDGGKYFDYDLTATFRNLQERSDFKKGVPAGAGDPSVFFNQNIAIVLSVDKGGLVFPSDMKPSFGFYQATNGNIPWRGPFKKIDASMTSKSKSGGAVATFQTKEKAPPQFDAWTFYWNFPTLTPDAKLHYVVLQPDGKEYCRYELEQPSFSGRSFTCDFQPGFAGGDPAVFFNQQIRFIIRARDGDFSFQPEAKFVFHFFKKDEQGKINWRAPFASIDAVMSGAGTNSAEIPSASRYVAGSLDTTFDPGRGIEGRYGRVYAMTLQSDGKLIIAGNFSTVNGAACKNIARLNPDGTPDSSFKTAIDLDNTPYALVNCVALQTDGKIIVAGSFKAINGLPKPGIARLTPDGQLDEAFQPSLASQLTGINRVEIQKDGKILVGGYFTNVFGKGLSGLVRLNSDGTLDSTFQPDVGANGNVTSLAVQQDGRLLVAGRSEKVNGIASPLLARLKADGSLDASFKAPVVFSPFPFPVRRVAVQPEGKIVITGNFTNINDHPRDRIARLNPDGSVDESFNWSQSLRGAIDCLAVQPDNQILVGGTFSGTEGAPCKSIARLNPDGSLDTNFVRAVSQLGGLGGRGWDGSPRVFCFSLAPNGKVFVGGDFDSVNDITRNSVARLNADGSLDRSFDPGSGVQGSRGAGLGGAGIALQADGKILISGSFWKVNGVSRNGVARLNADGSVDTTFDPGSGANGRISALAMLPDGKILVGGSFSTFAGQPHRYLVRLNSDGSLDGGFNAEPGLKEVVGAIVLQGDGKILMESGFEGKNGLRRNRIVRLNADGSLNAGFNVGTGPDSSLWAIVPQPDGKIVISGWFTHVSGVPRAHIARLNSDGSLDASFDPGSGLNTAVFAAAVQRDGKVVIAGGFTNVNGRACQRIARLNPDGSVDPSFHLDSGMDQWVFSLALQADGKILAGGWFENVAGVPRGHIVRLNQDGTLDTSFDPGTGANSLVSGIILCQNGDIMICGQFSSFNNIPRLGVARLHGD